MAANEFSGTKLKNALNKFGSLQKANEGLEDENQTLQRQNAQLKQVNAQLQRTRDAIIHEIRALDNKLTHQREQLLLQSKRIEQADRQYHLFESFVAMVLDSPSRNDSVEGIKTLFQSLADPGWKASHNLDDLRSLFVSTIMGDYLKCFRCDRCGASFIVNKEPYFKYIYNYYECPACHDYRAVKANDAFLKAMVPENQLENIRRTVEIEKENDLLRPFKLFFDIRCEVCGKPITEWNERNIKQGIGGLGWGHAQCWNSPLGKLKLAGKFVIEQIRSHPQAPT